jgi:hypothetical protein
MASQVEGGGVTAWVEGQVGGEPGVENGDVDAVVERAGCERHGVGVLVVSRSDVRGIAVEGLGVAPH